MKQYCRHHQSWVKPFLLALYCIYYMRLFGTTFAFQQDLRKCSEGILRLGRQGLRRAMIMRRLANDTEVDIDVTKASTIVQADTAATSTPTSSSASSSSELSSNLRFHYRTLLNTTLCKASCIITTTPSPDEYDFTACGLFGEGDENHDGIVYTHDDHDLLTEEIIFGKSKEKNRKGKINIKRLNVFLGGRIALRRAFKSLHNEGDMAAVLSPLYSNSWGAPTLPVSITASISHKANLAVGLAKFDSAGSVGVDLEHCNNKAATTIIRRVITSFEKNNLGKLDGVSMEEEVLVRFSFKEAIYKAIHPFIPRSIDFAEVEVQPLDDGTASINFILKTGENFEYEARWQRYRDKYWLTCVYVRDPSGQLKRYNSNSS